MPLSLAAAIADCDSRCLSKVVERYVLDTVRDDWTLVYAKGSSYGSGSYSTRVETR